MHLKEHQFKPTSYFITFIAYSFTYVKHHNSPALQQHLLLTANPFCNILVTQQKHLPLQPPDTIYKTSSYIFFFDVLQLLWRFRSKTCSFLQTLQPHVKHQPQETKQVKAVCCSPSNVKLVVFLFGVEFEDDKSVLRLFLVLFVILI